MKLKYLTLTIASSLVLLISSCSVMIEDFQKLTLENKNTYTVQHWFEKADVQGEPAEDDFIQLPEIPDESIKGEAGDLTEAEAKSIPGFTNLDFEQKIIKDQSSTFVKIYYVRKSVKIFLNCVIFFPVLIIPERWIFFCTS